MPLVYKDKKYILATTDKDNIDEMIILYSEQNEKIYVLNETASIIYKILEELEVCTNTYTVTEMFEKFLERFMAEGNEFEEEIIREDILSLINQFIETRLIEEWIG